MTTPTPTTELVQVGNSLQASLAYAHELANSGLLPAVYRRQPANVLFALEMGRTLGITTMAAITGIHVIEGKPSPSPALMTALIRKAGHRVRVRFEKETGTAWATITRADDPEFEFRSEWTIERAVQAGLCTIRDNKPYARSEKGKPTSWEKYWQAMLKWRALSEVSRDAAEDCLFGMHYVPEELGVEVNEDGTVVEGEVIGQPVSAPPAPTADPDAQKYAHTAQFAETKTDIAALWREAGKDVLGRHVVNTALPETDRAAAPLAFLGDVLRTIGDRLPDAPSEPVTVVETLPDTAHARALTEAAAADWEAVADTADDAEFGPVDSNPHNDADDTRPVQEPTP